MSTICFLDRKERAYNERVTLTSVDLNRVDNDRLMVDRVSFNDRHIVSVDRECEVRVTGHRDEAETVALALRHVDDREVAVCTTGEAAETVDQRAVSTSTVSQVRG